MAPRHVRCVPWLRVPSSNMPSHVDEATGLRGPAVVVICGPIASGKSTLAISVAEKLQRHGIRTATIDLDTIYVMLDPTVVESKRPWDDENVWSRARHAAGTLAST